MNNLNPLISKLPHIGTTIFTQMSVLAAQHKAINLSQGFPDFDGPDLLRQRLTHHTNRNANQYAPMTGTVELRTAIAEKTYRTYGFKADPESEITVTSGATEALFCAISALVSQGDEVIVFDPAYDSYEPVIKLNGGTCIHLALNQGDYHIDWNMVKNALGPKTRMIILNSPHNPTGAVISREDLVQLAELIRDTDILILSDEVYEHIVFEPHTHHSLLAHDELSQRSLVVSSFGKTYHVTGWKLGYCIAPAELSRELRKVHQYVTFCSMTPAQLAMADFIRTEPLHDQQLSTFYQQKRDCFNRLMANSRFSFKPSAGTYFQLMDYAEISDTPDIDFSRWLTSEVGVAAIPVSVFYETPPEQQRTIRFCFAKNEHTLENAAKRLCQI